MEEDFCANCGKLFKKNYKSKKFCSIKCVAENTGKRKMAKIVSDWKNGIIDATKGKTSKTFRPAIRKYLLEKYNYCCYVCGFNKLHPRTNMPILQIHHIDENPTNNNEDNLVILCPNCHALADSKNSAKGNGRRYERLKYREEVK